MSFLVTARKYRPATFKEVVAQGHVVHTLLNSIRMERIAHAYLFSGPRGVGKTTTARIFAKALNCPDAKDGEPCNICTTCQEISEGRCIDILEIDGASNNGVDQVRDIRSSVHYTPTREKYKMYIIDEVHMLTTQAFNALLKTLEEPPAHAIFIFATTEAHKVPATVISRCQRYDFKRIGIDQIVGQLKEIAEKENIEAEDPALFIIAKNADGSMRDAESIFDQVVGYSGASLTYDNVKEVLHVVDEDMFFETTDSILAGKTTAGFEIADRVVMSGHDIMEFLSGLEEHFRNILVVRTTGSTDLLETSPDTKARYTETAKSFEEGDLLRLLKLNADTMYAVKQSVQPRLKLEVALVSMMNLDTTVQISDLLQRIGSIPFGGSGNADRQVQAPVKGSAQEARTGYASAAPVKPDESISGSSHTAPAQHEIQSASGKGSGTGPAKQKLEPPNEIVRMLMDGLEAELLTPNNDE
jgi:DNA polymerase III subunit gamma/tau